MTQVKPDMDQSSSRKTLDSKYGWGGGIGNCGTGRRPGQCGRSSDRPRHERDANIRRERATVREILRNRGTCAAHQRGKLPVLRARRQSQFGCACGSAQGHRLRVRRLVVNVPLHRGIFRRPPRTIVVVNRGRLGRAEERDTRCAGNSANAGCVAETRRHHEPRYGQPSH